MLRLFRRKTPATPSGTPSSATPSSASPLKYNSIAIPLKYRTNALIRLAQVNGVKSPGSAPESAESALVALDPVLVHKGVALLSTAVQITIKHASTPKAQTHTISFKDVEHSDAPISPNAAPKSQSILTFKSTDAKKKKKSQNLELALNSVLAMIPGNASDYNAQMGKKLQVRHNWVITMYYGAENAPERLDFVLSSQDEYDLFYHALSFLLRENNINHDSDPMRMLIMRAWMTADENTDGLLDLDEIQRLLKMLNLSLPKSRIKALYAQYDADNSGMLDFSEFMEFYKSLLRRDEPDRLFAKYRDDIEDKFLYVDSFNTFLREEQHETLSREETIEIMKMVGAVGCGDGKIGLSRENFSRYFFSNLNYAIPFENWSTTHQDMDQPLTHYWIASSNNTYLTQDQLKGESSVSMYRKVLHKGCRCVSLDCWDGSLGMTPASSGATSARSTLSNSSHAVEPEPVVTHGRTLTSKISFREVIECIDANAFTFNPFPVIVSLEVHCSLEQQEKMAQILRSVFGEKIFTLEELNNNGGVWPSPNALQRRIIIKAKRLESGSDKFDDYEDDPEDPAVRERRMALLDHKPISEALASLVTLSTVTMVGVTQDLQFNSQRPCWEMHNFSENRLEQFLETQSKSLAAFTKDHFVRVHPKSTRFNSSNFSPVPGWLYGCQMVAVNYQTLDKFFSLHQLLFNYNARCGLLLKPQVLREGKCTYSRNVTHKLKIQVVCAEQLPAMKQKVGEENDIMDPYVRLQLITPTTIYERSTSVVQDNGFAPNWNEEFEFDVKNLDVDMLRLSVFDKNENSEDTLLVEQLVRVADMQHGYRLVPMCNREGKVVDHCLLLLNIRVTEIVNVKKSSSGNLAQQQKQEREE